MRGKIFPMGRAEMVHLVIHFVWEEQGSEVRIFRFTGSGQWPGREGYKIRYKEFWGKDL